MRGSCLAIDGVFRRVLVLRCPMHFTTPHPAPSLSRAYEQTNLLPHLTETRLISVVPARAA
jgi:hypothetical protein